MHPGETEIMARIERIEDQLRLLSAHAGIPYGDGNGHVPEQVVALAHGDERIKAALKLTEMTGMDFGEAQRLVKRL
jgi:predicted dienelactone hydrolase